MLATDEYLDVLADTILCEYFLLLGEWEWAKYWNTERKELLKNLL